MAVPFYIPEQNESGDASNNINHYPITTSSATQTPLPSPVSSEHLIQAFYNALYSCSINGSPDITQSQSCNAPLFIYEQGDMFLRSNNVNLLSSNNATVNEELQERSLIQQNQSFTRSLRNPICYNNMVCYPSMVRSEVDKRFENYMLEREKLEEFSGRLPIRKKKKTRLQSKFINTDFFFKWSTVVTVVAIVMGCGLLATR